MRKTILVLLLLVFGSQIGFAQKPPFKGTELERLESLRSTGFDKEKLDVLTKHLKENSKTTGMLVLYDGKVVYEYGDIKEVSYLASCRKSVLSMLYGKHVENGTVDLKETIDALEVDENDGLLEIEKTAIVDHIITSRSGVFHVPANGGYDEKNVLKRGSVKPGEYFLYNNWDFNVAGYILEKKTGKTVYQELEQQLARPLGFQDWDISKQKRTINEKKSRYSAYHMYLSTRDMAKIGQLMLNQGEWNGKQIIPKDWIRKITTTVTPTETINKRDGKDSAADVQFSYGYMWWLFEDLYDNKDFEGAYTASGYGGQFITVIPKRKVVIAHKTKLDLLTKLGMARNYTTSPQYWKILDTLMRGQS